MGGSTIERATLLVVVGSASIAFMVGFNLGAFNVVFFGQLLIVWVIATIVLVASIVSDLPPDTWPRRLILVLPSLWMLARWLENAQPISSGEQIVFALTVVVTVVALPFQAWILVTAINTDFADLPRGNKVVVIVAVAVTFVVGLGLGYRNDTILTCDDFESAGSVLPENCIQVPPE
jgi:hypothetical protein